MSLHVSSGEIVNNNVSYQKIVDNFNTKLLQNVTLADYTTWHVGGKADFLFQPKNLKELQNFLQELVLIDKTIPIYFLGLGSNVLIRDGGLRGIVILTNSSSSIGLHKHEIISTRKFGKVIQCEAGVPSAKLAKFLAKSDYPEGAFWAGIPGTMGGALAMNAGCYGSETWEYVVQTDIIDRAGNIYELGPHDFDISYRSVKLKDEVKTKLNIVEYWFLNAILRLAHDDSINASQSIRSLLQKRTSQQPIGQFSGGSVFRNPIGNFAAKLIDECGLKGVAIGGAYVSSKHANFIINDKTATAKDIELLITYVQKTVYEKYAINLEPEIRIIGEL